MAEYNSTQSLFILSLLIQYQRIFEDFKRIQVTSKDFRNFRRIWWLQENSNNFKWLPVNLNDFKWIQTILDILTDFRKIQITSENSAKFHWWIHNELIMSKISLNCQRVYADYNQWARIRLPEVWYGTNGGSIGAGVSFPFRPRSGDFC